MTEAAAAGRYCSRLALIGSTREPSADSGSMCAFGLGRGARSPLYGLDGHDPVVFVTDDGAAVRLNSCIASASIALEGGQRDYHVIPHASRSNSHRSCFMTIDRRRFLQVTTVGIATVVSGTACTADAGRDPTTVARPALLAAMEAATVREIGARYRETVPGERDAGALRSAIAHDARRGLWLPWKPSPSLEQQVSRDFATGKTVIVRGWVLSVTEARQCALFSLGVG